MTHRVGQYAPVNGQDDTAAADDTSTSTRLTPASDFDHDDDALELQELAREGLKRLAQEQNIGTGVGAEHDGEEEVDDDDDEAPLAAGTARRRSSAQSFELYTPDEERAVKRKLDTRLVLYVSLLYMLSFLDRSNIGNCKVAGMMTDLRLDDDQFEWLLQAFYITYVLFEWMTICYKIFPPHIYLSCIVFLWGFLASLQSLATTFTYELVIRALLGVSEAAFVGMPIYLSFFFRREELAFRTGIFIAAAPLATSFASSLAYAIMKLGSSTGITSWRLLFLLEGFPACIIAVWTWYWIADSPSSARWLTARERKVATLRLRRETGSVEKAGLHASIPRHKQKIDWHQVWQTLKDPKSYITAGMFFCCNVAFSSMPVFLPTIINQMGWSQLASQGLAAPPFLFAFFVVLITAFVSDRLKSRSIPLVVHALLAASGYGILAAAGAFQFGHAIRYLAVFPICAGFFSSITIIITWTVNNQTSDEGKSMGMMILNVIGQLGPLLGTRLYPDEDGPYFVKGMSVCAGAMGVVAILAFVLRIVLQLNNRSHMALVKRASGGGFEYII